uniref:Uncharacterized protein n=1 Tax=Oryza rufipogon TaxID=4529 RepID=A0A0E0PIR1_ORYRU
MGYRSLLNPDTDEDVRWGDSARLILTGDRTHLLAYTTLFFFLLFLPPFLSSLGREATIGTHGGKGEVGTEGGGKGMAGNGDRATGDGSHANDTGWQRPPWMVASLW